MGRLNVPTGPGHRRTARRLSQIRGWTLVTRNAAGVARSGVALLNPFEPAAR
jgi:hypothetical protein